MKTLYIIGNGFDRYHGLDTRYQTFAFYLQDNYSTIYEYLINYYGLPDLDRDDEDCYNDPLWADFEKALADLDFQTVLDDNTSLLPNFASDEFRDRDYHTYQIEMELIVDDLTKNLFKAFKEFILNLQFPASIDDRKLCLNKNALYLNFNYTDTLEKYYEISTENILYIHKKAKTENTDLVLGHGIDPDNFISEDPKPPEGLSDDAYEAWRQDMADNYDYSYETGKSELMSYFTKSFKQTEKIIEESSAFFKKIARVDKVIILGHSLSDVDKPYLSKVFNSIINKNSIWTVSYYSNPEKATHTQKLIDLGLHDNQINLIKIDKLRMNSWNCLVIYFKNIIQRIRLKVKI